jgi:hypothetical protein
MLAPRNIPAARPLIGGSRPRRVALAAGVAGMTATGLLAVSLIRPAAARGLSLGEVPVIGPPLEVIKTVLHPLGGAVVDALVKVLQAIFGGVEAKLITGVINALLTIPNFDNGQVAELEKTTVAIAMGMLSAVLTLSIVRYYVAGLTDSGSGGFEALQGLVRVIGAVSFIIVWPGLFNEVVKIPRLFNAALLGSGSVQRNVALLFDAALVFGAGAFAVGGSIGLIFPIMIGLIAAVVFILLLWMKVQLAILLMFLYVSMPLAVVLWPVPELSWLSTSALKTLFVALIVPCVWAILFALSAAINTDVLTWVPTHSVIDTVIVRPLAGITLMILCITIPRFLMRTAMIGPQGQPGGGRMWRMVALGVLGARAATGAGRAVAAAAAEGNPGAQRMIDALPSPARPPSGPGEGSVASRVVFGRSGFGSTQAGGSAPGGRGGAAAAGGAAEGREGAASALARSRESLGVAGIERPEFDRNIVNQAGQEMHARSRIAPPSAAAVSAAMAEFPAETQRGLADFNSANPLKLREFAAQHLHSSSLNEPQRDALMTIGSARADAVDLGMNQALTSLDAHEASHQPAGQDAPAITSQPGETHPAAQTPATPSTSAQEPPASSSGTVESPTSGSGPGAEDAAPPQIVEQPSPPAPDTSPHDPAEPFLD